MIEAVLLIHFAISGGYNNECKQEIKACNEEIRQYFYNNKITLPIIPEVDMLIDLCDFADGLSQKAKEWLEDANGRHRIYSITIKKGHVELDLDS